MTAVTRQSRVCFLLCFFLWFNVASANDFQAYVEQTDLGKIDWDNGMIYGVGKGYLYKNGQSRVRALRAARALAFQSIVKLAASVKVNDRNTMTEFANGAMLIHLEAFVSGYEEVSNKLIEGNQPYIEITYRVPLHGVNGVGAKLLEKVGMISPGDNLSIAEEPEETWLVLDARKVTGKQVTPALFPKVVSQDETLYQIDKTLDKGALVNRGMARYVVSDEKLEGSEPDQAWLEKVLSIVIADANAGERKKRRRYIVKKVEDIKGLYKTNLVVSAEDAKAIKAANTSANVLQKTRVVVVVSSAIGGIEGTLQYQFGLR